ncbi:MAG TPA: bifunctional diaminohydroxyphosphoribosylaminopyrimidine deaminase/5-amino-6-(5-phosphoribosylamino)uracil reductase RibD [Candidatus Binataceae bacterium]|nr:bifunctional diaminohydroxyphosphoribosylaminopyrimidine deaminase/5-amino-6-(5-phosphoribosylamino)uracil reductase RibD [Candidatus Binataceae bacterium]
MRAWGETDRRFMARALALAERVAGLASPNPAVGCLIVRNGKIVGSGATAAGGRPHAEALALARAGSRARGATAYVSFEPCAHFGKTPPCAVALKEAGVARVVIGCVDPYPPVRGRGIAILRRAGIPVTVSVMEKEARRLNEGFITRVTKGRPLAILKLAMSLDGKIAARSGGSRWISGAESRELAHQWRRECDAVMVGAGTVIADNPRLTCRIAGGRDPVRVIVDGRLRSPANALVFRQKSGASTILATTRKNVTRAQRKYGRNGVEVIGVDARGSEISLSDLMREFGRRGWCKVMVEGGSKIAASALAAGIVDRVAIFVAPRIIGAGVPAIDDSELVQQKVALHVRDMSARRVGCDYLLEGHVDSRPIRTRKSRIERSDKRR